MKDTKDTKDIITVMCDYCADGLWLNGSSIDADYLVTDLGFKEKDLVEIKDLLIKWQKMYESFVLYLSEEQTAEVYASNDFILFLKLGEHIFFLLDSIPQEDYVIEYFDEKTSKRYIMVKGALTEHDEYYKE